MGGVNKSGAGAGVIEYLNDLWPLITFFIGIVFTASPILWRALRFQSGYKLSGRYLSRFEDIENGEHITQKSTCRIRQLGGNIWFNDKTESGRSWTLKGEIDKNGRILGRYGADQFDDTGVGVFYFSTARKPTSPVKLCYLDGFWAGYDHAGKENLLTGGYFMAPQLSPKIKKLKARDASRVISMMEKLSITHINEEIAQALRVADETLGKGYVSSKNFDINYGSPVILGAWKGNEFAGFIIAFLLKKGAAREIVFEGDQNVEISTDVMLADEDGVLGVIKTVGVAPNLQGHGIGTTLISQTEKQLKKLGARTIVIPAWENGDGNINIGGVVTHLGYRLESKIEGFWKADCDAGNFNCPEGRPGGRCVCSAVFFSKNL